MSKIYCLRDGKETQINFTKAFKTIDGRSLF